MLHQTPGGANQPRLFGIFMGVFVAVLVLVPGASSKIFSIGPFHLPGGTIIFPITFILNDILTEVYGYAASRQVIWTGLCCQLLAAVTYWAVGALPPAAFWPNQEAYELILGFAPRVAVASLVAYFCGEFANSFVLSKMKYWHQGQLGAKQGWRFVASTIVGEAVDTLVFMGVAFSGTIPEKALFETLVTLYVVKVLYEVAALPLSMRFANWVKRVERVDHLDVPERTNYNPFSFFLAGGEKAEGR